MRWRTRIGVSERWRTDEEEAMDGLDDAADAE